MKRTVTIDMEGLGLMDAFEVIQKAFVKIDGKMHEENGEKFMDLSANVPGYEVRMYDIGANKFCGKISVKKIGGEY